MEEYTQTHSSAQSQTRRLLYIFVPIWIFCLGIAGFFFLKARTVPVLPQEVAVEVNTTPAIREVPLFLSLIHDSGASVAVGGEVLVSGRTLPRMPVLVYTDIDQNSVDSDGQGQFETSVMVGEQGGAVRVTVFGDNGEEKSETIAYQPLGEDDNVLGIFDRRQSVLDVTATPKPNSVPTEFVPKTQLRVRIPTEVQDITAKDFLQNKARVSVGQKIGTLRLKEFGSLDASRTPEFALGKPLLRMRVAQATPGAILKRHATMGVVTSITSGVITVAHQIQSDRVTTVLYNNSTAFFVKGITQAKASDITVGMRIAVVGVPSPDGLLATRVHSISGKAVGIDPVATPSATLGPTPIL